MSNPTTIREITKTRQGKGTTMCIEILEINGVVAAEAIHILKLNVEDGRKIPEIESIMCDSTMK